MRIVCLHGFLGLAGDFDYLKSSLCDRGVFAEIFAPDLWALAPLCFEEAARKIADSCKEKDVLLGYSMGGRIAARSFFIGNACKKGGLVVASAHCGGLSPEDEKDRIIWNEKWAKKFETEKWESLMHDWNAQPLFEGDRNMNGVREEHCFDRRALAHALRAWSVVNQPDARPFLSKSKRPVLWLAGERDEKYSGITRTLEGLGPNLHARAIKDAGHRLPFNAKNAFADMVAWFLSSFFSNIEKK